MKNRRKLLERVPNSIILLTLLMIFLFEIIFYIIVKSDLAFSGFAQGGDADYYHSFAIGSIDFAVNVWPEILRYLNNNNFYSRFVLSFILLVFSLVFIPFMANKIAGNTFRYKQKYYLYLYLLCLIYPTLYFFTFDVYRDVFMVACFLIGCFFVKKALNSNNTLAFISFFTFALLIGGFLTALRPYLGVGFIGALFLWNITFTKRRLIVLSFLYLLVLFSANYVGIFDSLTEYRAGFEEGGNGSTLGLDFSNPAMFIPNFILSFLGQILGLYITNPLAIILLLVETVPFLFMLIYVVKNIKWADKFVRFLIVFFVLYGSVWLIGNDNLGTAVRLRLYNYFAIYISFFYILNLKEQALKNYIR